MTMRRSGVWKPWAVARRAVLLVCLLWPVVQGNEEGTPMASPAPATLRLDDVTMLEAVHALRERRIYVQFERERLDDDNTDRTRPIVDARRRFTAALDFAQPVDRVLGALTQADGGYDWVQLTDDPASYWVFPRADGDDRFAASVMAWPVGGLATAGRNLTEVVAALDLPAHGINVFDRPGFLGVAGAAPPVATTGRPLYAVLGELFASGGKELTWTLGGLGDARVLSISMLPPVIQIAPGP